MTPQEIFGTAGPVGGIGLIIGYVGNLLLKRRSSETGVVETTKATLEIVREQQDAMAAQLAKARYENDELRTKLRDALDQVDRQRDQIDELTEANAELRRQVEAEFGGPIAPVQLPRLPEAADDD